jgi:hypothetical protein
MEDSRGTNGIVNYWYDLPFMPSFSSEIAACEDGKDHWVNMNLARGSDTGDRVVKAAKQPARHGSLEPGLRSDNEGQGLPCACTRCVTPRNSSRSPYGAHHL